jgi:hypothetical protein
MGNYIRGPKRWKVEPIDALTDVEIAYMAGLLDGEGHFGVHTNKVFGSPRIVLAMTHEGVIQWFSSKLSIVYHKKSRVGFKSHWKDQYQVSLSGRRCAKLCRLLYPHLIVKSEQAKLIWEYVETYTYGSGYPPTVKACRTSKETRDLRISIKLKIQSLNGGPG